MTLQLLLPWRPAPVDLNVFATHLPMFNQSFGDLGPYIAFRKFEVAGSNSAVTVDVRTLSPTQLRTSHISSQSVRASSILVQTSGAEISGNFSASDDVLLDTINGYVRHHLRFGPRKTQITQRYLR